MRRRYFREELNFVQSEMLGEDIKLNVFLSGCCVVSVRMRLIAALRLLTRVEDVQKILNIDNSI